MSIVKVSVRKRGRRREINQRTQALVIVGAIALFLVVAAVVAGLVIGGVIGSVASGKGPVQVRIEQPKSMNQLRDGYKLETGSLEVNLEDLTLPEDTTELEASVENGALTVVVPKGVAVSAHAEVGNDSLSILGTDLNGENLEIDGRERTPGPSRRLPTLSDEHQALASAASALLLASGRLIAAQALPALAPLRTMIVDALAPPSEVLWTWLSAVLGPDASPI